MKRSDDQGDFELKTTWESNGTTGNKLLSEPVVKACHVQVSGSGSFDIIADIVH